MASEASLPVARDARPPPRGKAKARRTTVDMGRSSASPRLSAKAPEGGIVKLGRREAWARFLAYEVLCEVLTHCFSARH